MLTSVASLMVALDVLVVSTALSTIRLHLHASIQQLEWTVNAYSLSFAVLLMTASALGDRYGRRRLFARRPRTVRDGLGGVRAGAERGLADRRAGAPGRRRRDRRAAGAGAAERRVPARSVAAQALGIFSGITGLAVLGGPVVGGAVTQGLAWQWIFWLNVPIGLLAIPLVLRADARELRPARPLDVPGLALVTGAALGIVWGLVRGNSAGWGSLEVVGALSPAALWASRSSRGSCAPASRCCRCRCSAHARSRPVTRRRS